MEELRPGTFTRILGRVAIEGNIRAGVALGRLARGLEKDTKVRLTAHGGHRPWEPTPSRPGEAPAIISGTLRRSITHDPVHPAGHGNYETRVGTARGFFPNYPVKTHHRKANRKGPTPANKYGYYLETGLRNGATYPFLSTAYREYLPLAMKTIWRETFGGRW